MFRINLLGKYACNGRKVQWLLDQVFKSQADCYEWLNKNFKLVAHDPKSFGGEDYFAYEILEENE